MPRRSPATTTSCNCAATSCGLIPALSHGSTGRRCCGAQERSWPARASNAPPDADGAVEIGYRVDPRWRRQGLATEMVVGLLAWARLHGAARCLASVAPDNAASLAVIARLGFVLTGEQMDDVDGLELVHTLELR